MNEKQTESFDDCRIALPLIACWTCGKSFYMAHPICLACQDTLKEPKTDVSGTVMHE